MKKFFAHWIVYSVLSSLLGLFFAGVVYVDYVLGPVEKTDYGDECSDTLIGCLFGTSEIFGFFPLFGFGMMMVVYPVFKVLLWSFRIVFSKDKN